MNIIQYTNIAIKMYTSIKQLDYLLYSNKTTLRNNIIDLRALGFGTQKSQQLSPRIDTHRESFSKSY